MIIWNLISIILIILTLNQAHANAYKMPKLASWATVSAVWFVGSIILFSIT